MAEEVPGVDGAGYPAEKKKAVAPRKSVKLAADVKVEPAKAKPRGTILNAAMNKFRKSQFVKPDDLSELKPAKVGRLESLKKRFSLSASKAKAEEEKKPEEDYNPWVFDEPTGMWYHLDCYVFVSADGKYFVYYPEGFNLVEVDAQGGAMTDGEVRPFPHTEQAATKVQATFRGRKSRMDTDARRSAAAAAGAGAAGAAAAGAAAVADDGSGEADGTTASTPKDWEMVESEKAEAQEDWGEDDGEAKGDKEAKGDGEAKGEAAGEAAAEAAGEDAKAEGAKDDEDWGEEEAE